MNTDQLATIAIIIFSVLVLLIFVRKHQVRQAFLAYMVAQLFSWPLTLLYVQFGFQTNPVRLFPHATESNFLFAFIFHPSIFSVYYVKYPKTARRSLRIIYSLAVVAVPIAIQYVISLVSNLVAFQNQIIPPASYVMIFTVYNISRVYLDRYFLKVYDPGRNNL